MNLELMAIFCFFEILNFFWQNVYVLKSHFLECIHPYFLLYLQDDDFSSNGYNSEWSGPRGTPAWMAPEMLGKTKSAVEFTQIRFTEFNL